MPIPRYFGCSWQQDVLQQSLRFRIEEAAHLSRAATEANSENPTATALDSALRNLPLRQTDPCAELDATLLRSRVEDWKARTAISESVFTSTPKLTAMSSAAASRRFYFDSGVEAGSNLAQTLSPPLSPVAQLDYASAKLMDLSPMDQASDSAPESPAALLQNFALSLSNAGSAKSSISAAEKAQWPECYVARAKFDGVADGLGLEPLLDAVVPPALVFEEVLQSLAPSVQLPERPLSPLAEAQQWWQEQGAAAAEIGANLALTLPAVQGAQRQGLSGNSTHNLYTAVREQASPRLALLPLNALPEPLSPLPSAHVLLASLAAPHLVTVPTALAVGASIFGGALHQPSIATAAELQTVSTIAEQLVAHGLSSAKLNPTYAGYLLPEPPSWITTDQAAHIGTAIQRHLHQLMAAALHTLHSLPLHGTLELRLQWNPTAIIAPYLQPATTTFVLSVRTPEAGAAAAAAATDKERHSERQESRLFYCATSKATIVEATEQALPETNVLPLAQASPLTSQKLPPSAPAATTAASFGGSSKLDDFLRLRTAAARQQQRAAGDPQRPISPLPPSRLAGPAAPTIATASSGKVVSSSGGSRQAVYADRLASRAAGVGDAAGSAQGGSAHQPSSSQSSKVHVQAATGKSGRKSGLQNAGASTTGVERGDKSAPRPRPASLPQPTTMYCSPLVVQNSGLLIELEQAGIFVLEVADGELVRHTDLVIDERTGVLLADWAALQHLPGRKELFYRAQQAVGAFSLCYVLVHGQVPSGGPAWQEVQLMLADLESTHPGCRCMTVVIQDEAETAAVILRAAQLALAQSPLDADDWLQRDWLATDVSPAERMLLQYSSLHRMSAQTLLLAMPLQVVLQGNEAEINALCPSLAVHAIKHFCAATLSSAVHHEQTPGKVGSAAASLLTASARQLDSALEACENVAATARTSPATQFASTRAVAAGPAEARAAQSTGKRSGTPLTFALPQHKRNGQTKILYQGKAPKLPTKKWQL